jgi:GNAT superfamily N-acetyltransferase
LTCVKRIRPASGLEDARAISRLLLDLADDVVAEKETAGVFLDSLSVDSVLERLGSAAFDYWVACSAEGRISGVVGVRHRTHLYHLFVARSAQGEGLGNALFHHARNKLGEAIRTVNASISAVRFYEKLGFTADGEALRKDGLVFLPMSMK